MDELEREYVHVYTNPSDINEHIQTLFLLATECEYIIEAGVRSCISTWALLRGLVHNKSASKRLVSLDLEKSPQVDKVTRVADKVGVSYEFVTGSDIDYPNVDKVDMTFIDTWHIYGHLKRELEKFAPLTNKYIVLHDTTVDAVEGESIRCGHDILQQMKDSGYSYKEVCTGLWPAVEEFLVAHPEFMLQHRYTNCNGLTVLVRVTA